MHELAVCQAMLRQVEAIAEREQAQRVLRILVRIGPLSGVEPELLLQAFPLAVAGTRAESAQLQVESLAIRVRCADCETESDASPNRLLCAACGSFRTRLLSGDELLLTSVELERADTPAIG
jgi:hydrogenase nickel incorporation protein HypA/HybF